MIKRLLKGLDEAFDWFARGFLLTVGALLALYVFGVHL
jgi:hypothetical protein